MKKSIAVSGLALAGVLASALSFATAASASENNERCYGIALKGQNDCKAGAHDCKGLSTDNFDRHSFTLVPQGECAKIKPSLKG